jgi:hypothetical protein
MRATLSASNLPFGARHTSSPGLTIWFALFLGLVAARKLLPMIPGTTITGTTFDDGSENRPRVVNEVGVSIVRPVQLPSSWGIKLGKGRVGSAMHGSSQERESPA